MEMALSVSLIIDIKNSRDGFRTGTATALAIAPPRMNAMRALNHADLRKERFPGLFSSDAGLGVVLLEGETVGMEMLFREDSTYREAVHEGISSTASTFVCISEGAAVDGFATDSSWIG